MIPLGNERVSSRGKWEVVSPVSGYSAWPVNQRAEFLLRQPTSWSSDAWFFVAWIVLSAYVGVVGVVLLPTAGLAVVGLVPAVAIVIGVAIGSRRRLHTVWGAGLVPAGLITGIAIGTHHYIQGKTCTVTGSAAAPASGQPVHQVASTTCTTNHAPPAFAHLWPYILSCVVVLLVAAALTFAFGRAGKKVLTTPIR